jgi:hypothetical protein
MIDWQAIENTIQGWVKDQTDLPVIWEDQSEARPDGPYGSVRMLTGPLRKGHDEFQKGEDPEKFQTSGLREFSVSVNIYRAEAFSKCSHLHSTIEDVLILDTFRAAGLAYIAASAVRNLTKLSGSRYESRFQFDVRFRLTDVNESDPGLIEHVEIEDEIIDNLLEIDK